jgi:argininosuccinate synthase
MRNIEAFLADTQKPVTGDVFVKLLPYRFEIQGIKSDHDLMQSEAGQYGEMNNGWSGEDVKGFTKILSNQLKISRQVAVGRWQLAVSSSTVFSSAVHNSAI